jgi:hypothetical protein
MKRQITKISNGETINLAELSIGELDRLHYTEESYCARELKKLPPFSSARESLLAVGMELVLAILRERQTRLSFGVIPATLELVCEIVRNKQKENNGKGIVFYEGGVGEAVAMEHVLTLPNVIFKGCDVYLSPRVKELLNLNTSLEVCQSTIFHSLQQQPENSIDIFYADNVFEHMFSDEIDEICRTLSRKLRERAYVILVIPNRYDGPHDVSKYFQPKGSAAQGFHFMELTYKETTILMRKHGFVNSAFLCRIKAGGSIQVIGEKVGGRILNSIKTWAEPFVFRSPAFLSRRLLWRGVYDTYVMRKQSDKQVEFGRHGAD